MDVSNEEKERILDEKIADIMHLLAVIYPVGCDGVIEIPPDAIKKKSENRLTLRSMIAKIFKLIENRSRHVKRLLFVIVLLSVTGCKFYQVRGSLVVDEKEAENVWSKTHSYIALNSPYRIDTITDYVIKTESLDCNNSNNYKLICFAATRELNDGENMFFFQLATVDFDDTMLKAELEHLKKYVLTEHFNISNKSRVLDYNFGTIDDLQETVRVQALEEMTEEELKSSIKGLSKKSLEAITIEQLRKLYRLEYRE